MKQTKVWLILALVFFAGFAGGVLTTRVITRRVVQAVIDRPELLQRRIERQLDRKLDLDSEQQAKIRQTLKQTHDRLRSLRREFQPRIHEILLESRRQISAELNPKQQERFKQFLKDHPLPGDTPAQE